MNNIELYNLAKKYLGTRGADARSYCGLPNGAAWCCAFVTWIFYKGNDRSLFYGGNKVVYCPTAISWCRANLAQIPIYLALPMDIIFFDWQPNGTPDHIGFVRERKSDQEVYTIEGNTSGGIVAQKTRTEKYVCGCFRPHFKPTGFSATKKLDVDGYFGYNSIAVMQKWLKNCGCYTGNIDAILGKGTIKALQKKLGVAQDGSWGTKTSKALQRFLGVTVDGAWGVKSTKAFQTYLNKVVFSVTASNPSTPVTTNAQKIVAKAKDYAWAYGTAESKWAYKTGSAKSSYKSALKKYLKHSTKIAQSDCGYFITTCVRASGVSNSFLCLRGAKESFPSVPSSMQIVWKGSKIPTGTLKAGDIVRYKKTSGSQHTLMYIGDGKIAEAGRKIRFPRIAKDSKKYNASGVKFSTIQVIRAK